MSRRFSIGLLVAVPALGACAGGAEPSPTAPPQGALDLDGRTFLSTSVADSGADRPIVPGTRIQLGFQAGRLTASAGCNTMGGRYAADAAALRLIDTAVREMAVPRSATPRTNGCSAS